MSLKINVSALKRVCLIAVALVAANRAGAQIGIRPPAPHLQSIEIIARDSATIATGRVIAFESEGGYWGRWKVTIAVKETLKGDAGSVLDATVNVPQETVQSWVRTSALVVVATPKEPGLQAETIDLSDPKVAVLTADLKFLRGEGEIIRALRQAILAEKSVANSDKFTIPIPAAKLAGTSLSNNLLRGYAPEVDRPMDERLNDWARRQIRSRVYEQRIQGSIALGFFKSNDNVKRLEGLLKDPGYEVKVAPEGNKGFETRLYMVRWWAYTALKSWGVKVETPAFGEDVSKLSSIEWYAYLTPLLDSDFAALRSAKNLKSLELANQAITMRELEPMCTLTHLRHLSLDSDGIHDEALSHLREMIGLESMVLDRNPITDAGLKELAKMPNLKYVSLHGTDVTTEGLVELRRVRPDMRVVPETVPVGSP